MSLSPELHALLTAKLDTFEKLELVLVLRGTGKPETLDELAKQLQVGTEALRRVAEEIVAVGMIEARDGDTLRLHGGIWDPLLDEAARNYAEDPKKLMRVFTSIAMERIRGLSARTFADAFRFRKKGG